MATRTRRTVSLAGLMVALLMLSACATTYDSAGNSYFSVWPFIGSRNPDLQLNYPAIDPARLQLGRDPDPLYFISPQPPIDPRVTSPYSQAPADPETRTAAVSDNAGCVENCLSKDPVATGAVRAGTGDDRRIASR